MKPAFQQLEKERPWGLVRWCCAAWLSSGAWLRAVCSGEEKVPVSLLGGGVVSHAHLAQGNTVEFTPCLGNMLTDAKFTLNYFYFPGGKKKGSGKTNLYKNYKIVIDSLHLAPEYFLLSLKISPALPRRRSAPSVEDRHFKEWARSCKGNSPPRKRTSRSVLSKAATQSQGDVFERTTHLNVYVLRCLLKQPCGLQLFLIGSR